MKRILLLLLSTALFASCGVIYPPYSSQTYSFDYSKYTGYGFFITESSSVSFDYDPVASVVSKETSGTTKTVTSNNKIKDGFKVATAGEALNSLVTESIRLGADGIIGLKVSDISTTVQPIWTASGMAIKRK